ncbi:GntR family transcriptional regulator [Nocardiopsis mangrovi]|uniref:GntR family transcriptional regulator n=1 Tax=Nocardiopsis mangrovi TaxID=1179818 RepID=A0ABV9E142_9ACTN
MDVCTGRLTFCGVHEHSPFGGDVVMAAPKGTWARVVEEPRNAIIGCAHPPGAPLSEVAPAEADGTSRTPIREALEQLQVEGLVEIRRGSAPSCAAPRRARW